MLQTHTIDPEDPASSAGQALYTITAGGFSATADAFARDEETEGLWFVSMVGSQTALKAIWASLLKQPPDVAHIIKGADGMALHGGYQRCIIPYETIGTWTTKIARLPGDRRLARPGVHENGGVRLREGLLPPAGAVGGGGPGSPSPFPRQAQPASPPRLLGRLALGTGPERRGDRSASVRGRLGLQVLPQGQEAARRPVRRRGVGPADAARGGVRWIGC